MNFGDLAARIRNIFQPAEFVKRNDDGTVQIQTAYNRTIDNVGPSYPYGFSAKAKKGTVTVLCAGGSLDAVRVLPVEDMENAPELEEGDVALWNDGGAFLILKASGTVELANGGDAPELDDGDFAVWTAGGSLVACRADGTVEVNGTQNGGVVIGAELKKQLSVLTARVDAVYNALQKSPTAAQDGGATYKSAIATALSAVTQKEDFSNIESDKVKHGTGAG